HPSPPISLPFLFHGPPDPRALHSFPTRRSSDLLIAASRAILELGRARYLPAALGTVHATRNTPVAALLANMAVGCVALVTGQTRSEEHTSELQSRSDLVCRLLLEKKKKKKTDIN